ncbi:MAG: hypothetical protein QOJ81_757 [Chloroflexota bacterium]|jgi:hypothetical protein|nr:hypothetical protein [Chloroflexota bacterium]
MTSVLQRVLPHARSHAVGYLALFVALGGSSYAITNLPARSVGTKQLRAGAVTSAKISKGSIGIDRINPTELLKLLADSSLHVQRVVQSGGGLALPIECASGCPVGFERNTYGACPTGTMVLSGGFENRQPGVVVTASEPTPDGRGWMLTGRVVEAGSDPPSLTVAMICGAPVTASASRR